MRGGTAIWLVRRITLRLGSARDRLGPGTVGPFGERSICLIRRGVHVDGGEGGKIRTYQVLTALAAQVLVMWDLVLVDPENHSPEAQKRLRPGHANAKVRL